jgi:hypothetical protein
MYVHGGSLFILDHTASNIIQNNFQQLQVRKLWHRASIAYKAKVLLGQYRKRIGEAGPVEFRPVMLF